MGIAQFLPMVLQTPAAALGFKELAGSLCSLSKMADSYRSITRLGALVDLLSPEKMASLTNNRDPVGRRLGILEYLAVISYFPCEHVAVMHHFGILTDTKYARFGGLAVFFWFWSLVFGLLRSTYQALLAYPYVTWNTTDTASVKRKADFKKLLTTALKQLCFLIFSTTCIKKAPQLLTSPQGVLMPLHVAVERLAPPVVNMPDALRGLLGTIATLCDVLG